MALVLGDSRLLLACECVAAECIAPRACLVVALELGNSALLLGCECGAAGACVLVSSMVNVVSSAASRACAFDLPRPRTIAFQTKQHQ